MGVESATDLAQVPHQRWRTTLVKKYGSRRGVLEELLEEELLARVQWPKKYNWRDANDRRAFLSAIGEEWGVKEAGDWARVPSSAITKAGGSGLLIRHYKGSFSALLKDTFSELAGESVRTLRPSTTRGHWAVPSHVRAAVEEFAKSHGIVSLEDWRQVSKEQLANAGLAGALGSHQHSVLRLLRAAYGPEVHRALVRPARAAESWEREETVVKFVRAAEERMDLREPEEWYRVGWDRIKRMTGGHSFLEHVGLPRALALAYPDLVWDTSRLQSGGKRATQRLLFVGVRSIFVE